MIKHLCLKIFCCFALLSITMNAKANENFSVEVESALNDLFISCSQSTEILYELPLARLLDYILQEENISNLPNRNESFGYFSSYKADANIQTITRYLSDPFIPKEIFFPNQIRTSYITNRLDLSSESTRLWSLESEQSAALHLNEYEATTVHPKSKAWYAYLQNSVRIKSNYQGKPIFCIVESQEGESAVGRMGLIVGLDSNHNYIYTNKSGSAHKYLSWLESKISNLEKISIFYPINETQCKIFVFTWLKKTIFNYDINSHEDIKNMQDRQYLNFLEIISNKLPEAKEVASYRLKLDKVSDADLDEMLKPYNEKILNFSRQLDLEQNKYFQDLFSDQNYLHNLNRPEKISIIMQEFIDEQPTN